MLNPAVSDARQRGNCSPGVIVAFPGLDQTTEL
jgi:hypothetical protein